ncbi:DUF6544 family protein [Flavobacterium sp. H122]|uniref:DUF6544 family protein n=1 Tax=Flavobacterium sp. H122 TaxID=2529860 RepID=UPI0010A9D740|nr:DUF6544 family protein [Flavobacterium sp. H122]
MKTAFIIIVFLHGLIHLLGFIKAFELKEIKNFTLSISRPMGIAWLIATILFLAHGCSYFANFKYNWFIGFIAVVISQILILIFWKDAKLGTLLNIIIFSVSFVDFGSYLIKNEFTAKVKNDFSNNNELVTDILTEPDIVHLPSIIQKYLHYTKSVGQPKVKNFKAEFFGRMRGKPNDEYMELQSVQYNFFQKPSRCFFMEAQKMKLPATGLHLYQNEKATFEVKILNWLKIIDAKGIKLNQAETVTFFNDMCCIAPATLIDRKITWKVINDTTAKGIYKNGKIKISAVLYFNKKGQLLNFISNDRFETDGKQYKNYPWATPVEDYRMINGYFLPGKAKLVYQKPEEDFTYGELEYKSVKYNLKNIDD